MGMDIGKYICVHPLWELIQDSISFSVNSSVNRSVNHLVWTMAREKLTVSVRASIIWR